MRLNPERAAVEHESRPGDLAHVPAPQRQAADQAGVGLARDRSEAGKQDEVVVGPLVAGGYRPTPTSDARSVARDVDANLGEFVSRFNRRYYPMAGFAALLGLCAADPGSTEAPAERVG